VEAVRGRLAVAREAVQQLEARVATARKRLAAAKHDVGVAAWHLAVEPRGGRGGGD
jgi:hypothetical protein